MAGLVDAGRNVMLNALFATSSPLAGYVSLHTADPSTGGTSEVTGGSPAYARKAITWANSTVSSKASASSPVFDVPSGVTITHVGYWSAATAGTFYGSRPLDSSQTYATQGTYTLTSVTETLT